MLLAGCGGGDTTGSGGSSGGAGGAATTTTTASSSAGGETTTSETVACTPEDDGDPCTSDDAVVESGLCVQHHAASSGAACPEGACFLGACVTVTCSDPLLAFEPNGLVFDASPFGPAPDEVGGIAAGRTAPFDVPTKCHSVVVGLGTYSGYCDVPAALDLVVWSELTGDATQTPAATPVEIGSSEVLPSPNGKNHIFKVAHESSFEAGAYPFVGFVLGPKTCASALTKECDPGRAWWYRPQAPAQGWAPLSKPDKGSPAPAAHEQLYLGFADCEPTK